MLILNFPYSLVLSLSITTIILPYFGFINSTVAYSTGFNGWFLQLKSDTTVPDITTFEKYFSTLSSKGFVSIISTLKS